MTARIGEHGVFGVGGQQAPGIPPVPNPRAPKRSDRYPEAGPVDKQANGEREDVEAGVPGVLVKSYPCWGSQIPCSQIIRMNINPAARHRGNVDSDLT
jgi:hypothetical protein